MSSPNANVLRRWAPYSRLLRISTLLALAQGAATAVNADMDGSFKARPAVVTPVYQIKRPSYDAPGIEAGGFLISP